MQGTRKEELGKVIYAVSTVAFIMPALGAGITLVFLSFLAFEACVGCYFPVMGPYYMVDM